MAKTKLNIRSLFYITHCDNLPSIIQRGILSHAQVEANGLSPKPVYDKNIVLRRRDRRTPDGRSLWEFANLYFQPRNPMLYRVVQEAGIRNVVVIGVDPKVMEIPGCFVSDGNAAHSLSNIWPLAEGLQHLAALRKIWDKEWWREADGSKRQIMAELLVPDGIPPAYLQTIYTADHKTVDYVRQLLPDAPIDVVPEPNMFFNRVSRSDLPIQSRWWMAICSFLVSKL